MISKQEHLIKELNRSNQPVLVISESEITDLIAEITDKFKIARENQLVFTAEEGVEQLRVIINSLFLKPLSIGKKLFCIEKSEALSVEQVNTLLKLLEEPPPHALILLSSNNLSSVIKTIRSRCKIFVLGDSLKTNHDRESSIIKMLGLPFAEYIDKINTLTKEEFAQSISAGLEDLKKKMLNKDGFGLFKYLAAIRCKIQNTNVNYKLLAEDLYIKEKTKQR